MTPENIMRHSRRFLYSIYQYHVDRALENLGITEEDSESEDILSEEDYPEEYKIFNQSEREQYISKNNITTDSFMADFTDQY